MACHAVVQRALLEAWGIVPVDPRTTAVVPVLSPPARLDMCPMFADDGFLAGPSGEVLRALKHIQPIMPGLGLRFSMLEAIPAAGLNNAIDLEPFRAAGCTCNETGNFEVLKSPVGAETWCHEYAGKRAGKAIKALEAVSALPDRHAAYYLMKWSCNAGQLNYLARTTPRDRCEPALQAFDDQMRESFMKVTGLPFDDAQWAQAMEAAKKAGLGSQMDTKEVSGRASKGPIRACMCCG